MSQAVSPTRIGDDELPELLGRYRRFCKLDAGGMASVHLARVEGDDGFGGVVAVKCIHPSLAHDAELVNMFLDEARIASKIHHPNVCRVQGSGEVNGTYYLAMEYLLGESLGQVMKRVSQRRETSELLRLPFYLAEMIAQVCDGLHAAHELRDRDGAWLGVIHRDVSPQNLFVGYDGRVKVVDFGLARAARRLSRTRVGTIKGKVSYIAPESIGGALPDRRVDVWSAGVCLWEAVTLERLFDRATDLETVMAVRDQAVPPARSVAWWVPPRLDAIILRALSRDPSRRFGTAEEMAQALRAFLAEEGRHVSPKDLAAFMGDLFPDRRAARLRLLEEAMAEPEEDLDDDDLDDRGESSGPSLVDSAVSPAGMRLRISREDLSPRRRRRGRTPFLFALSFAILLAAAAGWALAVGAV